MNKEDAIRQAKGIIEDSGRPLGPFDCTWVPDPAAGGAWKVTCIGEEWEAVFRTPPARR